MFRKSFSKVARLMVRTRSEEAEGRQVSTRYSAEGFAALLAVGFLFSLTLVFMRELSPAFTPYQQVLYRNFFAFFFVLPFCLGNQGNTANPKHLLGLALTYPFNLALLTLAVLLTDLHAAVFALYFASLTMGVILGRFIFDERLNARGAFGITFAIMGLLLHSHFLQGQTLFSWGFFFGLLSGVGQATNNLFRKLVGSRANRFQLVLIQCAGGIFVGLALVLFFEQALIPEAGYQLWLLMGLYGLLNISFAFLILVGFQNFDLGLGQAVLASELIFASMLGIFIYGEIPTTMQALGIFAIFVGIILVRAGTSRTLVSFSQNAPR